MTNSNFNQHSGEHLDSSSIVQVRVPRGPDRELANVIAAVVGSEMLLPFDDLLIDYCAEFSRTLARSARGFSELQALAFWMRRAELVRMREDFHELATERTVLLPRGLVVHIPPANVDTIFIYSWLLSLLCGNHNIVRLSSRATEQTDLMINVINELGEDARFSRVTGSTAMIMYGHDDITTAELSERADLRVIWGGDGTVRNIRRSPLSPHATDLTFPDRVSLAAFDASSVEGLGDIELFDMAARFYNDAYWFDQMGCSSPRMTVWVGDGVVAQRASQRFFQALYDVTVSKGLRVETSAALSKITYGFSAPITHDVGRVRNFGNQVLVIDNNDLEQMPEEFVGSGTFHSTVVQSLPDIAPMITRRYQTLSHFGFSSTTLRDFVQVLAGRGVDRLVPIGQALTFNRFWDGNDLFQALTRYVYIDNSQS